MNRTCSALLLILVLCWGTIPSLAQSSAEGAEFTARISEATVVILAGE